MKGLYKLTLLWLALFFIFGGQVYFQSDDKQVVFKVDFEIDNPLSYLKKIWSYIH